MSSRNRCNNFLIKCNKHCSHCRDLPKIGDQVTTNEERADFHSVNKCSFGCSFLKAFLIENPEFKEGFHFHYKNGFTEERVKNFFPNPEFNITAIKSSKSVQLHSQEASLNDSKKEKAPVTKARKSRKSPSKSVDSNSASRSRSRSKVSEREARLLRRTQRKQSPSKSVDSNSVSKSPPRSKTNNREARMLSSTQKKESPSKNTRSNLNNRETRLLRRAQRKESPVKSADSDSISRSPPRSKTNNRNSRMLRRTKEKEKEIKKAKGPEHKKEVPADEEHYDWILKKIKHQDNNISNLNKKTNHIGKDQTVLKKALRKTGRVLRETKQKVEKLEISNEKMVQTTSEIAESNRELFKSNQSMSDLLQEVMEAEKKRLASIFGTPKKEPEIIITKQTNTDFNPDFGASHLFSSDFLKIAGNNSNKKTTAATTSFSAEKQCKPSSGYVREYDNLMDLLMRTSGN